MNEHQKSAEYHRGLAKAEFDKQGQGNLRPGEYIHSRSQQESHQRAAERADRAHAEATGQTVVYTPIGAPVFRKKY